ncbi:MAG: phosphatidylglycerol lysyltransferase domain-containing protein [Eubacteriales bacterium]|nr:phosphatidylglycerol lysyltransferase domain-containing protein [Eubacteriales bacterium]
MQFQKITMDHYDEIKNYLWKSKNRGCNFSAGNIIIWGSDLDISYGIVDNVIVFRTLMGTEAVYHIAEYTEDFPQIIQKLSEDARGLGVKMQLADLNKEMAEALEEYYPSLFQAEYDRDGSDYVYEVQALAELRGKKYQKKKNHVNRFKRNYEFTYETLNRENIPECIEMAEKWREGREMNSSLEAEKKALENAFRYYEPLGFQGGLLRVNGEVMAFTLGEAVTEDTFVTHFEKALDSIPELYAMINQQFAMNQLRGFRYVNREEDLGVEGLRKAKTSYHPVFMVEEYRASLKECCSSLCLWYRKKLGRTA